MSILTLPTRTDYSLKRDDTGAHVFALQRALNGWNELTLVEDGVFGVGTDIAVRHFQTARKFTTDGIAGPVTQHALVSYHIDRQDKDVPEGLLAGFAEMEGGWLLGAVNWSVPGGVDCGALQRRVYDEANVDGDFWRAHVIRQNGAPTGACDSALRDRVRADTKTVQRAFDVGYQARLLNESLSELATLFVQRAGSRDGHGGMSAREKAGRLAALNHNYPSGADTLSRTPIASLSAYWTTPQTWVTGFQLRFPNGDPVRTPLDWAHRYAGVLGRAHGTNGAVTKYVRTW
jgi:hypothetical protein